MVIAHAKYERGQQIATYRLQLPYKHSVPLLVLSTLGHWLVSNALFVIVSQGCEFEPCIITYLSLLLFLCQF